MNRFLTGFGRRLLAITQAQPSPDATPDPSDAPIPAIGDVRQFDRGTTTGDGGIFGEWEIDANGLPSFRYELDQHADMRARFPNSLSLDRREHWYPIGNDRVTGLAYNEGYVQLYVGDRGGAFLNRFDDGSSPDDWIDGLTFLPEPIRTLLKRIDLSVRLWRQDRLLAHWRTAHPTESDRFKLAEAIQDHMAAQLQTRTRRAATNLHYAGGFGYVADGEQVWSTAYRYRPKGALTRRIFGLGYFETEMTHRDIRVIRRTYAPYGDVSALLSDITIRNLSDQPRTIRHFEYWDVNTYQLKTSWFQTGLPSLASIDSREDLNDSFVQAVTLEADGRTLRSRMTAIADDVPAPDAPSAVDWYPADTFLIDLSDRPEPPAAFYTDSAAFFGEGDSMRPGAAVEHSESIWREPGSAGSQPFCMVQRRDLTLAPGEIVQLRYAYGTVRPDESLDFIEPYRRSHLDTTLDSWRDRLAYFSTGDLPALQREMAWHSYCLEVASVYNAYHKTHVITQGSAYLYLHGIDGVPRDQALFSMPMTYLRPDLARETLMLVMAITLTPEYGMSYGFGGYGQVNNVVIHKFPSDIDLFFLMALSEYLAATGDSDFLAVEVPFYASDGVQPAGISVLDHARAAFDHLMHTVNVGPNKLIRVGDGDWNDGIVFDNASSRLFVGVNFEQSVEHGESVPNTQMALHVLPLAAAVLAPYAPDLAERMKAGVRDFGSAVEKQWVGRWYTRAILRSITNTPVVIGKYAIDLESQVWALISGAAAKHGHEATLIEAIDTLLERYSPTGAPYLERGMISAAIAQLLTWGYSESRPDLAWRALNKLTFATRAQTFPETWFGIWTAPDSMFGVEGSAIGATWASAITPMTDFPAMNSNPHAMALLSLIRLCGIAPTGDGLRIAPRIPKQHFVLDLPLVRLDVNPTQIDGEYRAVVNGSRVLTVRTPDGTQISEATVSGVPIAFAPDAREVRLPLTFAAKDRVAFRVTWTIPPSPDTPPPPTPIPQVRL